MSEPAEPSLPATTPCRATTLPTPLTAVFKPTTPRFGGVEEVEARNWAAWTGGKPKPDWTGLEVFDPLAIEPTQYRLSSIMGKTKSQIHRVKGLEKKFSRGSDLQVFERKVLEHLTQHGMDTISYLKDPTNSSDVVSVVSEHARFNLKEARVEEKIPLAAFDNYNHSNVRDAKKFLLASLDEDLESQMYENCDDSESFIVFWLNLIDILRTMSIDRFDKIKDKIKGRSVKSYSGENVELLVSDYLSDWKDLHGAGMYDQTLTLIMLNAIMRAGGPVNEDFRHPLRETRTRLDEKLLEIRHYGYNDAHREMVKCGLDVRSVLKLAKEKYRKLYDDKNWPAATNAKDSKTISRGFGSVNHAEVSDLNKLAMALVKSLNQGPANRDKSSDTCNNCKKKGHWARDCPDKRRGGGGRSQSGRNNPRFNSGQGNSGRGGLRGSAPRGGQQSRPPPPKPGESEIKHLNGKKTYWCAKCNRWTLSHGTESHRSKEELSTDISSGQIQAGMARVDYDFHPAAFKARLSVNEQSPWSLMTHMISMFLLMSILFLSLPTLTAFSVSTTHNLLPLALQVGTHGLDKILSLEPLLLRCYQVLMTPDSLVACLVTIISFCIGWGTATLVYWSTPIGRLEQDLQQARRDLKREKALLSSLCSKTRFQSADISKAFYQVSSKPGFFDAEPPPSGRQCKSRVNAYYDRSKAFMAKLVNLTSISSTSTPCSSSSVLFDSGANCCITPCKDDFVGDYTVNWSGMSLDGIGKRLSIKGEGIVA